MFDKKLRHIIIKKKKIKLKPLYNLYSNLFIEVIGFDYSWI